MHARIYMGICIHMRADTFISARMPTGSRLHSTASPFATLPHACTDMLSITCACRTQSYSCSCYQQTNRFQDRLVTLTLVRKTKAKIKITRTLEPPSASPRTSIARAEVSRGPGRQPTRSAKARSNDACRLQGVCRKYSILALKLMFWRL